MDWLLCDDEMYLFSFRFMQNPPLLFFIDVHPPLLKQMALSDFIAEGHFVRHLLLYLERRNAIVDALTRELGDILDVSIPEAGMHLVAWLSSGLGAQTAAQQAATHGLHIPLISQFSLRPLQRDGLLLGFASASPQEMRGCASATVTIIIGYRKDVREPLFAKKRTELRA